MPKKRYDEDGVPILDEPLLSPKRIWIAHCFWCWFCLDGRHHTMGYWKRLWYHRRPYATQKAQETQ